MRRRRWSGARRAVLRCVGERPLPVGNVARDRRIIRRALRDQAGTSVLVIGGGLAARQAIRGARVDVVGTSPHSAEVTVCSTAQTESSLPKGRWSTVIVAEVGDHPAGRLMAARRACRDGGTLLLLDRVGWDSRNTEVAALADVASIIDALGRPPNRVWRARAAA